MPIKVERTKQRPDTVDSGLTGAVLTGHEYRFVVRSGAATGNATFIKPTAEGVRCDGVLMPIGEGKTVIASGDEVAVATAGVLEVEAGAAFNAGSPLMTDSVGRAIAATATKYITAIAREAASGAGHLVSVEKYGNEYKAS